MPGQQEFQIGVPQFDKAIIHLENGKKFTILNSGESISRSNIYLQGMNLNKVNYNKIYLDYNTIYNGGEFEVFTGKLPNKMFVEGLEKPISTITDNIIVSNPYIIAPSKTFKKPFDITLGCSEKDAAIFYTSDGSTPTLNSTPYSGPITISTNTTIKAIAIKNGKSSFVDEASFYKIRDDIKITLVNKYLHDYAAQGNESLINGLRGTTNWQIGNWQGWQGNDLVAILDFGQSKPINKISLGTLQDSGAWIVFPKYVQYWVSDDGANYKLAATINTNVDIKDTKTQIQEFGAELNTKARYVKVVAKQYGALPVWHEAKGEQSYIFADEITVE